jgi:hypothetical protein
MKKYLLPHFFLFPLGLVPLLFISVLPVLGDEVDSGSSSSQASPAKKSSHGMEMEKAADQYAKEGSKSKARDIYLRLLKPVANETVEGNSGTEDNRRLREKLIKLYHSLNHKWDLPEEAQRHAVHAEVFLDNAVYKGFGPAANEFQMASNLAPWWPEGYLNLGLSLEGLKDWQGALFNYKLFLKAASAHNSRVKPIREKMARLENAGDGTHFETREPQAPAPPQASKGWQFGLDASGVFGTFTTAGWPRTVYGWSPYAGVNNLTAGFDTGIYCYKDGFFISPGFEYQYGQSTAGGINSPTPLGILCQTALLFRVKFGGYINNSDFFVFSKLGIGTNTLSVLSATYNSQSYALTNTGKVIKQESGLALDYSFGFGYGKHVYGFLEGEGLTTTNLGPFTDGSASTDPGLLDLRLLAGVGVAIY